MQSRIKPFVLVFVIGLGLAMSAPVCAFSQSKPVGQVARDTAAPLLDQLKIAKDEATARMLEAEVWSAWTGSGDDQIDNLMQRSAALMQAQAFEEALSVLDAVVAKAPQFAEGWNKRATLLYMMHDFDRSLADISQVLALEPRHFGALSGMGLIRSAKGDKLGAVVAYKKVLEVDPQNSAAKASIDALGKQLEGDPI